MDQSINSYVPTFTPVAANPRSQKNGLTGPLWWIPIVTMWCMGRRSGTDRIISSELARMLRGWRHRLDPVAADRPGTRGRKTTMSQEYVAHLIGVSVVWYGRLERGICGSYSDEFLDRVASVLRLSDAERNLLYTYAVDRIPKPLHNFQHAVASESLRTFVAQQEYPAYISDPAWEIIFSNDTLAQWFPTLPDCGNIMRWVFLRAEARKQLCRWATDWASVMLAQLRIAKAHLPEDEKLENLVASILSANETARELWSSDLLAYSHPDGDVRHVLVDGHIKPMPVEILAFSPLRAPDCRLIILVPGTSLAAC